MTDKTLERFVLLAIILLVALYARVAHATCAPSTTSGYSNCVASNGANSPNQGQTQSAAAQAAATAAAASRAASRAAATGGSSTSNAQGGTGIGYGGNGGQSNANSQQTVTTAVGGDSYSAPRQAPPAYAPSVQPTASCKNSVNAGASTPFGGVAFGKGTKDTECDLRETARMLAELGDRGDAIALVCQSDAAKHLKQCGAPPAAPSPVPPAPAPIVEPAPLPLAVTVEQPAVRVEPAAVRKAARKAVPAATCRMPK